LDGLKKKRKDCSEIAGQERTSQSELSLLLVAFLLRELLPAFFVESPFLVGRHCSGDLRISGIFGD